jgi:tRNA A37 threonylcarbamoyladenosine biosynthesis protein TsaE
MLLGVKGGMSSPTFSIVNEYETVAAERRFFILIFTDSKMKQKHTT